MKPARQSSFADLEWAGKKRVTRRERFLSELERVVPWGRLIALIEPKYPSAGRVGRQPVGLERMLRLYFAQQWLGLSDEGLEDAVYDSAALRSFIGVDLQAVPDATTLLKFRRLLEDNELTQAIFAEVNSQLEQAGLLLREGTLVDATIIAAPSSTKNKDHQRDPEMASTKKGNQYHFGMKAHTGVDADSGLVHSLHTTAANEHDITQAHELLHGQESMVFADAGYIGLSKREEIVQAQAQGQIRQDLEFWVAQKRGKVDKIANEALKTVTKALEKAKAQIRARVEHPYHVIKDLFGYRKVRYKGLAKNTAQLFSLFAMANLYIARKRLMALKGVGAS
jgi:IS5 family transposase